VDLQRANFFFYNFEKASSSLSDVQSSWKELKNAQFFVTGGTGFFGRTLLHFFNWLNQTKGLNIQATVLTRSVKGFLSTNPEFSACKFVKWIEGDLLTIDLKKLDHSFTHIVHAATEASAQLNVQHPLKMLDTIAIGTRKLLEFATGFDARLLIVSSGAVYGPQSTSHVSESYLGGPPLSGGSAYGVGKRYSEQLSLCFAQEYGLKPVIARCFAFVGPYLPWDIHFAIGNFMRDAVAGQSIDIRGDGTAFRSYLFSTDWVVWMMRLLICGHVGVAYNVGSDQAYSIKEVAEAVMTVAQQQGFIVNKIRIAKTPNPSNQPEYYVPDVSLAKSLGLTENYRLKDSIEETLKWYKIQKS
jgi:nucleoside-diphosphate-sugar epimerase